MVRTGRRTARADDCAGVAGLALTVALAVGGETPAPGLIALLAFGAARVLIAWNPTDREGDAPTPTGRRHILLAALRFISIAIAAPILGLSAAFVGQPLEGAVRVVSILVPITIVATSAAGSRPGGRAVFGIVERLAYAAFLGWLVLAAVALLAG